MKNLKSSIVILLLSAAFATAVSAQEAKSQPNDQAAKSHFEENRNRLAITPEQQLPYKEMTKRYAGQLKEVRQSSLPTEEKRDKVKAISAERDAEMKTLLTPEQYKVYLQIQEERKIRMTERKKQ